MPRTAQEKAKIAAIRDELIATTRAFCLEHLDEEHADLAEKMVRKLGRKRDVPFMRGARKNWAGGVIYAIVQFNSLFIQNEPVHTCADDIADYFGAKKATISAKAKAIRRLLRLAEYDTEFVNQRTRAQWEKLEQELTLAAIRRMLTDRDA